MFAYTVPLVTASRATPHPVAPPPITKTSNSGVFFKALMCTDLDGRGTFGRSPGTFSAAVTDKKGFYRRTNWHTLPGVSLRMVPTFASAHTEYILRISRYLGFLWAVTANTGIFLRGLKLCRESRTQQVLLVTKVKIGGNHTFFSDNNALIWKKKCHTLLCILWLFQNNCCLIMIISEKCMVTLSYFLFGFQ